MNNCSSFQSNPLRRKHIFPGRDAFSASSSSLCLSLRSRGTLGQGAACTACPRAAGHSPRQGTAGSRRERAPRGLRSDGDKRVCGISLGAPHTRAVAGDSTAKAAWPLEFWLCSRKNGSHLPALPWQPSRCPSPCPPGQHGAGRRGGAASTLPDAPKATCHRHPVTHHPVCVPLTATRHPRADTERERKSLTAPAAP